MVLYISYYAFLKKFFYIVVIGSDFSAFYISILQTVNRILGVVNFTKLDGVLILPLIPAVPAKYLNFKICYNRFVFIGYLIGLII